MSRQSVADLRAQFARANVSDNKDVAPKKKTRRRKKKVYGKVQPMGMMMGMGPPKQLWEIMFDKFDADNSGEIDTSEFQLLTRNLGYAVAEPELEIAMKLMSTDNSHGIAKSRFQTWWTASDRWQQINIDAKDLQHRQDAASVFGAVDEDNSGTIDRNEFKVFYPQLQQKGLTAGKSAAQVLADLDADGDGEITYAEYVEWLARCGSIKVATFMVTTGAARRR